MSSRRSEKLTTGVVNAYLQTDFPDVRVLISTGLWKSPETWENRTRNKYQWSDILEAGSPIIDLGLAPQGRLEYA